MDDMVYEIDSDSERFWNHVDKTSDCWIWKGPVSSGYGKLSIKGKSILAHRWSYEEVYGPIPDGLQIDHLCGVSRCVKPNHLEAVTPKLNNDRRRSHSSYNPDTTYSHTAAMESGLF